jgi:transcriptional regulator with XRE-family HTH domain
VDVKALRARLEWSQTELARFLCVADSSVARWESGEREPTGAGGADLRALEAVTLKSTPKGLAAIKEAAARGKTIRSLTYEALENLGRKIDGR